MLPSWVTPPAPAATAALQVLNRERWLSAIAAAEDPCCPLWNRCYRLACDLGPPLHLFGPEQDNGSLAIMDASLCEFYEPLFLGAAPAPPAAAPLVYVPTLSLPAFAQHVLPRVPQGRSLVLVTGLADWGPARVLGGGSEPAGRAACEALLGDARILAWWAEMLDFSGERSCPGKRLEALPLGVDLHTLAYKPGDRPAWGAPQLPLAQGAALWAAAARAAHGDARVYVCWGIRNRRRLAVSDAAAALPHVYAMDADPPGSLLRDCVWDRMGACQWTACVQGYGRDCHRTWEVLALGGGVVVEDMLLTRRCLAGLPAVLLGACAAEDAGAGAGAGADAGTGAGAGAGAAAPRHTFSKPWKELGARLPTLAAACAAARGPLEAPCPALSRLAPAGGAKGSVLGALALALLQDEGGTSTAAARALPLDPPKGTNALLLSRTWVLAMRASSCATP
jgi:hypothetical protein